LNPNQEIWKRERFMTIAIIDIGSADEFGFLRIHQLRDMEKRTFHDYRDY
jgi:hypothetical protein